MYNLLIALAIAAAAFAVGWASVGNWIAGFAPAMLLLPIGRLGSVARPLRSRTSTRTSS